MAANEAEQAAAPTNAAANARPTAILDPEMVMAARRGDIDRLKELLQLNDADGDEQAGAVEPTAVAVAAVPQFVVEVDPPPAAPMDPTVVGAAQQVVVVDAPAAPSSLLAAPCWGDLQRGGLPAPRRCRCRRGRRVPRLRRDDLPRQSRSPDRAQQQRRHALAPRRCRWERQHGLLPRCSREQRWRRDGGEGAPKDAEQWCAASEACIDKLMSEDSELVCIPREEEEGGSPLYLAISLGEVEIARHLFDTSQAQTKTTLSYYSGPDGRNVLHAAVSRGQALTKLLQWLKDIKVDVNRGDRHFSMPVVSHLTTQRDKQTGSTPLHLAASLAGWPLVGSRSKWFPHVWPGPKLATTLLLDANTCSAYQSDNKGLYPIHVAAMNGSLGAVKVLLQRCPDSATLQDAEGRTFLHVAVEKKRYWVVRYVCGMPKFSLVLNVQDSKGDTALHRAIDVGNLGIFNSLIQNHHVRLDVPNKEALTPLDLSWRTIPSRFYYKSNRRCVIHSSLLWLGAPHGESRPDLLYEKHFSIPEEDKKAEEDKKSRDLTNATQVMGIVSVLVATVTFASAFTLPGGYVQSKSDGVLGTPVLAGSYVFDAFILADALAFMCSCLATFSLVFAGMAAMDLSIRMWCINFSFLFLKNSVRSLVAAFALGLYLMLAPVAHAIAIAVCVITFTAWIYGNLEAWQIFCAAYTACARGLGMTIPAACAYVLRFSIQLFQHFWSLIIIFGLPAIIRWIKVHHAS
ncbi:hypothetical protein ACP70R_042099 [Stipagrostis hirtigluma subsp. patula]